MNKIPNILGIEPDTCWSRQGPLISKTMRSYFPSQECCGVMLTQILILGWVHECGYCANIVETPLNLDIAIMLYSRMCPWKYITLVWYVFAKFALVSEKLSLNNLRFTYLSYTYNICWSTSYTNMCKPRYSWNIKLFLNLTLPQR